MTNRPSIISAALFSFVLLALGYGARAEDTFTVAPAQVKDEKAAFATVESIVAEPARTRVTQREGTVANS